MYLDCTLRDGGYYTNWFFEETLVKEYLKIVSGLPIDFVEVGYIKLPNSSADTGFKGRYYFLDEISWAADIIAKDRIALMCDFKNLRPSDYEQFYELIEDLNIGLLRIACDISNINEAIKFEKCWENRSVKLALNIMKSHLLVDDVELRELDRYDFVYGVDSFGCMFPNQVDKLIKRLKNALPAVKTGFHAHDNLSLAFANSLKAVEAGADIIDSTVKGMGRGAGNLSSELLWQYFLDDQHLSKILSLSELFSTLHARYKWGTNTAYMYSGFKKIAQGRIMDMVSADRLSLDQIVLSEHNKIRNEFKRFSLPQGDKLILVGPSSTALEALKAYHKQQSHRNDIKIICCGLKSFNFVSSAFEIQGVALAPKDLKNLGNNIELKVPVLLSQDDIMFIDENTIDYINEIYILSSAIHDESAQGPMASCILHAVNSKINELVLCGFEGYNDLIKPENSRLQQFNQRIIDLAILNSLKLYSITPTLYSIPLHSPFK